MIVQDNKEIKAGIKYSELIKVALNSPIQGGYTISDISQRVKLLDILQKAEKEGSKDLVLEDADFLALSKILHETKWNVVSRTILNLVNEFNK